MSFSRNSRPASAVRRQVHDQRNRKDSAMTRTSRAQESRNARTGMTHMEMKGFVRNHFEEFVNRKNLDIADVKFAPEFQDHGADVPPGMPPRPGSAEKKTGGG